jgi:hypothetical protein
MDKMALWKDQNPEQVGDIMAAVSQSLDQRPH